MSRKRRTDAQIKEDESFRILQDCLPRYWVFHDYAPDFGIDAVVELFEDPVSTTVQVYQTLGEVLFLQVKAQQSVRIQQLSVLPRGNVLLGGSVHPSEATETIDTVAIPIDTALLETVASMGAAIPVMLMVVALDIRVVYFVCLNDYVDKVLLQANPNFNTQGTVTVHLPTRNRISNRSDSCIEKLKFYAKRPKLYSAFNVFAYQNTYLNETDDMTKVRHFFTQVMSYQFWGFRGAWPVLELMSQELTEVDRILRIEDWWRSEMDVIRIRHIWHQLANLGNLFEELARLAWLPLHLSTLI